GPLGPGDDVHRPRPGHRNCARAHLSPGPSAGDLLAAATPCSNVPAHMRKNIVAGLACALLALPACPADTGTTTESNTVATTDDTTGAMTGAMTGGMTDE